MLVRIAMIEFEARRAKCLELSRDLGGELTARLPAEGYESPHGRHVGTQGTITVHQLTQIRGGQYRPAFHQNHVQADSQGGHAPRAGDRIRRRRSRDHQARGRENAVAMSCFDGTVDFAGSAEIIRRDDEPPQAVSRLVRKKWKNSTPSRNRRLIISGLPIISATMEAILDGRK